MALYSTRHSHSTHCATTSPISRKNHHSLFFPPRSSFEVIPDSPSEATFPTDEGGSGDDRSVDGLALRHRTNNSTTLATTENGAASANTNNNNLVGAASLLLPLRGSTSNPELGAAGDATSASSSFPASLSESESIAASTSIEAVGGRFSKSSTEREYILHSRKALLMQQAKK